MIAFRSSCAQRGSAAFQVFKRKHTHVHLVCSVNRNVNTRELIHVPEVQSSLDDKLLALETSRDEPVASFVSYLSFR